MTTTTEFLPRAEDRYGDLVARLEEAVEADIPRARTHINELVGGDIKLFPTKRGIPGGRAGG